MTPKPQQPAPNRNAYLCGLLKRPLVTEKAAFLNQTGQYVFEVDPKANKIELRQAFTLLYPQHKVTKIQTTKMYPQEKRVGRRMGHTSPSKKAVFTVQGDPIEIFSAIGGA